MEFSINLSISDVLNKDVVDFSDTKIYEYQIGEYLTIEITESEGIEKYWRVGFFIK